MAYVTLEELKAYLGIVTSADDQLLRTMLDAAQVAIERYCDRVFEAPADETRWFACAPPTVVGRKLFLDRDLCYIAEIINGDGEPLAISDLLLIPHTPPYHTIQLLYGSRKIWTYRQNPEQAIAIRGRWAYSITPPSPVVQAVKELTAWMYHRYDQQGSKKPLPSFDRTPNLPDHVQGWLEGYRKLV